MAGVRRILSERGVPHEAVHDQWLATLLAATQMWLTSTPEGTTHLVNYLELDWTRGDSTKDHYVVDGEERVVDQILPHDVVHVTGLLVSGQFTDPRSLRISAKTSNPCDSCSIIGPCLQNVADPCNQRPQSLCNHCLTHSEHPRLRDQGDQSVCAMCTVTSCEHNPAKVRGRPQASWG